MDFADVMLSIWTWMGENYVTFDFAGIYHHFTFKTLAVSLLVINIGIFIIKFIFYKIGVDIELHMDMED